MSASEIARLHDTLRRSFAGPAWHGPALVEALDLLDVDVAAMRPVPNAHTPWELVLHLTAWTREVTRRVRGAAPALPLDGDWPAPPTGGGREERARQWAAAREALDAAARELLDAVAALDPARLDRSLRDVGTADAPVDASHAALGVRHTLHGTLVGLAEHNAYHGGQLVLLARAAGGAPDG